MILADLLFVSTDHSRVVSRLGGKDITQDYYLDRLSHLYSALKKTPEEIWLLFSEDALDFSIALLALLCAGKKVVLAPNKQPGTLATLAASCDAVFAFDDFVFVEKPCEKNNNRLQASFKIPSTAIISIATSGSSGAMKQIDKGLQSFVAELDNLEKNWGETVADAVFFSTVSHQHIYGLLFRVLWPLRRGRVFMAQSHAYPESLFDEMSHCAVNANSKAVLISSPAHLTRIPEAIDGTRVNKTLAAVFSSGGPLPGEVALDFSMRFGKCPIEIFGSTETGGIAWRQQSLNKSDISAIWQAFPDVELKVDEESGCLAIRSPYSYQRNWFVMGDQADLLDGHRFVHRGRSDRIIKLEEKRLSLTAMEQHLMHHPWVAEGRLVLLSLDGRQMLGAVLVLNAQGFEQLSQGKHAFNECLKKHLLENFERVLLPRKWRYVTALPCNSQGKVVQQDLLDLFL